VTGADADVYEGDEQDSAAADGDDDYSETGSAASSGEQEHGEQRSAAATGSRSMQVPRLNLSVLQQLTAARDMEDAEAEAQAVAARARLNRNNEHGPGHVHLLQPVVAPTSSCSSAAAAAAHSHGYLSQAQGTASVGQPFHLPAMVQSDNEEKEIGGPTLEPLASPTGAWLQAPPQLSGAGGNSSSEEVTPAAQEDGAFFTAVDKGAAALSRLDQQAHQDQEQPEFFTCAPATGSGKAARVGADASEGEGEHSPAKLQTVCKVLEYGA